MCLDAGSSLVFGLYVVDRAGVRVVRPQPLCEFRLLNSSDVASACTNSWTSCSGRQSVPGHDDLSLHVSVHVEGRTL